MIKHVTNSSKIRKWLKYVTGYFNLNLQIQLKTSWASSYLTQMHYPFPCNWKTADIKTEQPWSVANKNVRKSVSENLRCGLAERFVAVAQFRISIGTVIELVASECLSKFTNYEILAKYFHTLNSDATHDPWHAFHKDVSHWILFHTHHTSSSKFQCEQTCGCPDPVFLQKFSYKIHNGIWCLHACPYEHYNSSYRWSLSCTCQSSSYTARCESACVGWGLPCCYIVCRILHRETSSGC